MEKNHSSRREFLTTAGAVAAATTLGLATAKKVWAKEKLLPTNKSLIPPLPDQWKKLDLAKILSYPAAFVSISQCNSLYSPDGGQGGERQWERGSLETTVKVANACRDAGFRFHWIGYDIFRVYADYPMTEMDRAQYSGWTANYQDWSPEKIKWDGELPPQLKKLVRPEDGEYFEIGHQSSFIGTPLKMDLAKRGIKTIVFVGIHLDWCIEGNSRAARDEGYLPIVVGDACACQKQEQEPAAFERITNFFAPVITSDHFLELMAKAKTMR
jgi:nicotinamidase-related amidase